MKAAIEVIYRDQNGEKGIKNLPNANPNYVPTYDAETAKTNAAKLKTATLALMHLTTNSLLTIGVTTAIDITTVTEADGNV